ncbi:MAG: RNA polymerase sigma factor RpoH [Burkholderiales bacterium]|nr:RNA polymerase sigma factor RpoH [Burkholderiales bacterium]
MALMPKEVQEKKRPSSRSLTIYKPAPLVPASTGSGSLDEYIRMAKLAPVLSPERERELALLLRDKGDVKAASELITSHLRLVISIARQYMGYGLPFPDLIQEGNIGLMKAVKRFDPDKGARLVTFAMTWIRSEIQEFVIRNWKLVKVATTKSQRKLFFNLRSMKEDTDTLTYEQTQKIASELEVKPREVKEMEMRLLGHDVSLDAPVGEESTDWTPEDWLYEEDSEPSERLARAQYESLLDKGLPAAIEKLAPRSKKIIKARWLYDETKGRGATLADLATEMGISQERVRQLEKKALGELKKILEETRDV